jgi:hypothetical protein
MSTYNAVAKIEWGMAKKWGGDCGNLKTVARTVNQVEEKINSLEP